MSSASTRTPTSIEVRPTSLTEACTDTTSPTLTGCRKLIWSSEAVTTGPPACRLAAIPAAVSISFMISPPCTLPMMLALDRSMCWDRVTSEARGGLGARSWAAAALAASRTWSRSPSSGRDPPAPVPISLTPPALLVVPASIPAEDSCPTSPASAPPAKDTPRHGDEARAGPDPGDRRRPGQGLLHRPGRLRGRPRRALRRVVPGRPADPARLRLLDLHRGRHRRDAPRLRPGPPPGRPRHPHRPGRPAQPRGRGQRGPGHERPRQAHRLLRLLQGPRRQQLGPPAAPLLGPSGGPPRGRGVRRPDRRRPAADADRVPRSLTTPYIHGRTG